jgi:hypothetical protein
MAAKYPVSLDARSSAAIEPIWRTLVNRRSSRKRSSPSECRREMAATRSRTGSFLRSPGLQPPPRKRSGLPYRNWNGRRFGCGRIMRVENGQSVTASGSEPPVSPLEYPWSSRRYPASPWLARTPPETETVERHRPESPQKRLIGSRRRDLRFRRMVVCAVIYEPVSIANSPVLREFNRELRDFLGLRGIFASEKRLCRSGFSPIP